MINYAVDTSHIDLKSNGINPNNFRVDSQDLSIFYDKFLRNISDKWREEKVASLGSFDLFNRSTELSPTDTSYEYFMTENRGTSVIGDIARTNGNDAPPVSVGANSYIQKFADVYCSISWNPRDIAASRVVNYDILEKVKKAAMRKNYETMNQIAFSGAGGANTDISNIPGILNNPDIIKDITCTENLASTATTGEKALACLNDLVNKFGDKNNYMIAPTVLAVSPSIYTILSTMPWSSSYGPASLITVFKEMTRNTAGIGGIQIVPFAEGKKGMKYFEANGVTNTVDYMILMNNSPDCIEHMIAQDFYIHTPQQDGYGYKALCISRTGGLRITQPKAVALIKNKVS